ncbi:hypothetical protein [Xenorhabdus budapestensis]|uniref:Uncharacterized protein n=1 Tax=Xenorhabdus budapestensis TaxID=290110 RepID=A0A2D0J3U0_XENBU|nr:hypothetical protein [Xenorhabdus budapestensis]PHM29100.1 hypothetical protein Xbud_00541 [Xenorhabdus budapestensis]
MAKHIHADLITEYRLKPRTIRIGEYDVPEPARESLKYDQKYFYPCLSGKTIYKSSLWINGVNDRLLLKRGLIHLEKDSAELHAKALISLTKQK